VEIGKLGFVFNFITYGGHQIDGLAAEEFATDLRENGMLALAKLQRKFRLLESPYTKPQTYVGGPRLDAALTASLGRNATTKAMGKGSTEFQHQIQTEVPVKVLDGWLSEWAGQYNIVTPLHARLRPHPSSSELLELAIWDEYDNKILDVVFASIQDRGRKNILSIRDQNTHNQDFKRKRLMALAQLFLIHRYQIDVVHYVTPTDDNSMQTKRMKELGIYDEVNQEIGDIIVATVNRDKIARLVDTETGELSKLIKKED
jgi:isocitrate lyase